MAFIGSVNVEFKVGDIVACHLKGFWRVTEVTKRYLTERDVNTYYYQRAGARVGDEINPTVKVTRVCNGDLTKFFKGGAGRAFDASYFRKMTKIDLLNLSNQILAGYNKLMDMAPE